MEYLKAFWEEFCSFSKLILKTIFVILPVWCWKHKAPLFKGFIIAGGLFIVGSVAHFLIVSLMQATLIWNVLVSGAGALGAYGALHLLWSALGGLYGIPWEILGVGAGGGGGGGGGHVKPAPKPKADHGHGGGHGGGHH